MAKPVLIQDPAVSSAASAQSSKKPAAKNAADQFLALLNVGARGGDFAGAEQTGDVAATKRQDALEVLAAPVAPNLGFDNAARRPAAPERGELAEVKSEGRAAEKNNSASETKPQAQEAPRSRNQRAEEKPATPAKADTAEKPGAKNDAAQDDVKADAAEPADEEKIAEPQNAVAPSDNTAPTQATENAAAINPASLPLLKAIEALTQQFLQDYQQLMQQGGDAKAIFSLVQNYQTELAQLVAPSVAGQQGQPALPENISQSVLELLDSSQLLMRQLADAISLAEQSAEPVQDPAATLAKIILPHVQNTQQQLAEIVTQAIREAQPKAQVHITLTQLVVENAQTLSADAQAKTAALTADTTKALAAEAPVAALPQVAQAQPQQSVAANPQTTQPGLSPQAISSQGAQERMGGQSGGSFREGQGQQGQPMVMAAGMAQAARSNEAANSAGSFARLLSQTPHTPLVEQVSLQVKTLVRDGGNQIRIQLNPHELGRIEIKLSVSGDGKTGVAIIADHRATMELLQRDTRSLEQALADAGLQMDNSSLSFNFRGDSQTQAQAGDDGRAWPVLKRLADIQEPEPDLSVLGSQPLGEPATGLDITI